MAQLTGPLTSYPARVSFAAYVVAILAGGFLLTLPMARLPDRPPVTFVDGLFTATSACCVTGLTVRSTLHDFSFFGQGVILALIQLGGLGIMTITTLASFQIGGQATLRQRAVIADTLGIKSGRDLRWVTRAVLLTVLIAEFLGFVLMCWATWHSGPPEKVLWRALFHSISAFCNAGFALGDDNLSRYAGNLSMNAVICSLIIVGGIGFPVIFDLVSRVRQPRDFWQRLSVQTKLMLLGTAGLLAVGAVSFWLLEWEEALAREPLGTRILMGLFHSTTCRTAGFNTVDYAGLASPTLFLTIILMAIGAGPCSTGGGFKVSTFMTLVVSSWTSFRGLPRANVFKRTIPATAVRRATATALLFGAVGIVALVALLTVESRGLVASRPRWFLEALFECISALATVGLSTGITSSLTDPGKFVLMALMLIGRLGPITAAVALGRQRHPYQPEYLEEEPLVG
ncbi:MAG: Ktr system potassium uptake protein [Planctomycetota bacterium]|jgi:trk system potassium uptake protein TrkH